VGASWCEFGTATRTICHFLLGRLAILTILKKSYSSVILSNLTVCYCFILLFYCRNLGYLTECLSVKLSQAEGLSHVHPGTSPLTTTLTGGLISSNYYESSLCTRSTRWELSGMDISK
jgi:hypothetical protein